MNYLIFGNDAITRDILNSTFKNTDNMKEAGIVGFVDDVAGIDPYGGVCHLPKDLSKLSFDKLIVVNSGNYSLIRNELIFGYAVLPQKIDSANFLLNLRIIQKGDRKQDAYCEEMAPYLKSLDHFDLWCGRNLKPRKSYEVYWDSERNFPYVLFQGKRIYGLSPNIVGNH